MRIVRMSLIASAVLGFAVASHAETVDFTYTPTGGSAVAFALAPAQVYSYDLGEDVTYSNVALSNGDTARIYFENPSYAKAIGDGSVNLLFDDLTTRAESVYTGVQLYGGSEATPTFADGPYALLAAPVFGSSATGTLVIDNVSSPVTLTPEPSSLILLVTGVLGVTTLARRRVFKLL